VTYNGLRRNIGLLSCHLYKVCVGPRIYVTGYDNSRQIPSKLVFRVSGNGTRSCDGLWMSVCQKLGGMQDDIMV